MLNDGIVYTEIIGEIKYDIICQQIDFIASLKNKMKNHYEFSDFTNVTGIHLSINDMERIAHYLEKSGSTYPHPHIAYYVVNDFQFGMARMFQTHVEFAEHPVVIRVFRNRDKALQFLKSAMKRYG